MRNPNEVFINGKCLQDILEAHNNWLNNYRQTDPGNLCIKANLYKADLKETFLQGVNLSEVDLGGADLSYANLNSAKLKDANLLCANLKRSDLSYADLGMANLLFADLRSANLNGANLIHANLRRVDLSGANLSEANLMYANLSESNLSKANLSEANLSEANLSKANLSKANLSEANLCEANLCGANLSQVIYDSHTSFFPIQCPEKGSFVGYKKCEKYIVELEIPSEAKRSSATSRKCRVSKAKTVSITNLDGSDSNLLKIASDFDPNFVYTVGEIVEVKDFDEDRWKECSAGIHCFITREEAVNYY